MTFLAPWLSPILLKLLALSLLHFLWQGTALAALAYVAMALCRGASARYAVGVAVLALMLAAPVGTFLVLHAQEQATPAGIRMDYASSREAAPAFPYVPDGQVPVREDNLPAYFLWLVEGWFAGVILLSLRSAGGFLLLERLRQKETVPVGEELLQMCLTLQCRMGLTRVVSYCESTYLDAPAVAGWIRPVVLLPMTALSGLSTEQLEAVIAHELAHIQRFDAFVNLFQVAGETTLFYHPAVWWLGRRIRAEREHCCDDAAVVACGSPVTYAQALTRLAEAKTAPELAMAANRSPLVERIARLLGANQAGETFRGANLSAGVLCLLGALLAGSAFVGSMHNVHAQTPVPAPAAAPATAVRPDYHAHVPDVPEEAVAPRPSTPAAAPEPSRTAVPVPAAASQAAPEAPKQSYIDSLREAGLSNLTPDELISLKVQGITAEYVKAMKDLGLKLNVDELVGIKVQGITPEYVKGMRATTGENLDADELIGLKVQGVTPESVKEMHDLGLKTGADELIGMKVQGITPEYVRGMQAQGLKVDTDNLIGMKVQGITPEYVKIMRDLGLNADCDTLIGMKVQGVTPAYVKGLQDAGIKVSVDEIIGAKIQGITAEFIAKARSHGFKDLTLDKLIQLKLSGLLDDEK